MLPAKLDHQLVNSGRGPLNMIAAFSATPVRTVLADGQPIPLPWRS